MAAPSAASVIITNARMLLGDVFSDNYRWTSVEMLLWLQEGQRAIIRARPQAYVTTSGGQHTGVAVPDPAALGTSASLLSISYQYEQALTDWLCFRALSKGGEGADAKRANMYFEAYSQYING